MATTRCLGKGQTFVTFMCLRFGSLYRKDLGWHLLKAAVIPKPAAPHRDREAVRTVHVAVATYL